MNTMDFLRANEHKSKVDFVSKAQFLKDNWSWLKYSYAIAVKVRRRMKELDMSQKVLALRLGCTQQHISVLLGGKANMTLETMAKLEQARFKKQELGSMLQSLKEFNYSLPENNVGYLNDSAVDEPIPASVKTSELVDGYKPRKKKGPKSSK